MRYAFIISILGSLLFWGCKKNVSSVPELTYKSANGNVLSKGSILQLKYSFTDKEADFDSIWIEKASINCTENDFIDSTAPIPTFPTVTKGNILLTFAYGSSPDPSVTSIINGCNTPANDTCVFKVFVRDKAGNTSNTAVSENIVLLQ